MTQNYYTGKLPANFIYLGILLFGLSIWRMIVLDWMGIVLFIISLLCLLTRSGVLIDPDHLRIKKYIGFLGIRTGAWLNIESFINLQIIKVKETQGMNVLSISRAEIREVYLLLLILPGKSIDLMSGDKEFIVQNADKISSSLKTEIINRTNM